MDGQGDQDFEQLNKQYYEQYFRKIAHTKESPNAEHNSTEEESKQNSRENQSTAAQDESEEDEYEDDFIEIIQEAAKDQADQDQVRHEEDDNEVVGTASQSQAWTAGLQSPSTENPQKPEVSAINQSTSSKLNSSSSSSAAEDEKEKIAQYWDYMISKYTKEHFKLTYQQMDKVRGTRFSPDVKQQVNNEVRELLCSQGVKYSDQELQDLIGIVQARMIQEDCGILPMIQL